MNEKVHVLKSPSDLERRARQIGTLAGRVVALVRQAQEKLHDERSWSNLHSSESGAGESRQSTVRRTGEWRRQMQSSYRDVRDHARQAAHHYPVHVALGAGLAGFIVGAALRVGRMHRAN